MALNIFRGIADQPIPLPAVLQATGANAGRPITAALTVSMVTVSRDGGTEAAATGTLTELGGKRSVYKPTAAESDAAETLVIAIDAGAGSVPTSTLAEIEFGDYAGGIWIDTDSTNTNTLVGRDGTRQFPVSTVAAAKTLATDPALNFKKYYVAGSVDLVLDSAHDEWTFEGTQAFPVIDLGSQNTNDAIFEGVEIKGTMGAATTDAIYDRCIISSVTAMKGGLFNRYVLQGTLDVSSSTTALFLNCIGGYDTAAPTISVGNKDIVNITDFNGGLIVADVTGGTTKVNIAGGSGKQINLLSSCISGTITIFSVQQLTDNTGAGCTVVVQREESNVKEWQDFNIPGAGMIEDDGSGNGRWTTKALEQAPIDWTAAEREQVRYRLQMDGTQTAPVGGNIPANLHVTTAVNNDKTGYSLLADQSGVTIGNVSNTVGANVTQIAGSANNATKLGNHASTAKPVTFTTGTTTTATLATVDGVTPSSITGQYQGAVLIFNAGTNNEVRTDITAYDGTTKIATITAVPNAVSASDQAIMV